MHAIKFAYNVLKDLNLYGFYYQTSLSEPYLLNLWVAPTKCIYWPRVPNLCCTGALTHKVKLVRQPQANVGVDIKHDRLPKVSHLMHALIWSNKKVQFAPSWIFFLYKNIRKYLSIWFYGVFSLACLLQDLSVSVEDKPISATLNLSTNHSILKDFHG